MNYATLGEFYAGDGSYPCYRPQLKVGKLYERILFIRKVDDDEYEVELAWPKRLVIVTGDSMVRW